MRHLVIHPDARDDLVKLRALDVKAAARIAVTLESISSDPLLLDKLTTWGNNEFGDIELNVKDWKRGRVMGNFWRFRILHGPATSYRIFYAVDFPKKVICVLAIVHKEEFNYDSLDTETARRIFAAWDSI